MNESGYGFPVSRAPFSFYEFFAGGGMARLGLGEAWACAFANDFDRVKAATYRANFADAADHLREGDVWKLSAGDLPGRADLAWASSPCQDLSLAGGRAGFAGGRSGAFFGFWTLMAALAAHTAERTARCLELRAPLHRARLQATAERGERAVGAVFRRMRLEEGRKVQRAEVRFDGLAGCLRTPRGGSSRQVIVVVED